MNVLDLFSGIGGFSLGLERAGMRTVAFCETDPFCRAVLRKHWPEIICYHDVRKLTAARLAADGISVDVLCGGFPCQDISVAGKAAGIEGKQSGLWVQFARLIGELRPSVVLCENVPALRVRGADRVLGDLEALGYASRPFVVGSLLIGAPFIGERVWIVATPRSQGLPSGWEIPGGTKQIQPVLARRRLYRAVAGSRETQRTWESSRLVESPVGERADGIPARLVRLGNGGAIRALGNSLSPQIPEIIGRAIMTAQAAGWFSARENRLQPAVTVEPSHE